MNDSTNPESMKKHFYEETLPGLVSSLKNMAEETRKLAAFFREEALRPQYAVKVIKPDVYCDDEINKELSKGRGRRVESLQMVNEDTMLVVFSMDPEERSIPPRDPA